MHLRPILFFGLLLTLLGGCMHEDSPASYAERIVIEGRIDQGGTAIVSLSLNKSFVDSFDQDEFRNMIVRWAKVTISDSERSEVLTGRNHNDYPTRYIYTGLDIVGKAGETYTLCVEYGGRTWSATTTIPQSGKPLNLTREWVSDSLYRLTADVCVPKGCEAFMIECAMGQSKYYCPALLGIIECDGRDTIHQITINRPLDYLNIDDYTTLFHRDDEVRLRLCTMGQFGYEYWSCWENINANSRNPLFPPESNPPTNFSGDAIGIWCGYGTTLFPPTY